MIWKGLFKEHKDGKDTDIAGKEEVGGRERERTIKRETEVKG